MKMRKFTKHVYINLAVLLVISLLVAAVASLSVAVARKQETRNDAQIYYDNKVLSYGVQNANLSKGQIVFLGDSITDLYILDDHYAGLDRACYNRGIGGDTTEGVFKRLQVSVFDLQPSVVVLMIGTNDINAKRSEDEILRNYRQIVEAITTGLPEATLYCVSVIPQNQQVESGGIVRVEETTPVIMAVNAGIQTIAQIRGAVYIDLFSLLADENNYLRAEYSDDGLHLNENGLSLWTAQLLPLLENAQ